MTADRSRTRKTAIATLHGLPRNHSEVQVPKWVPDDLRGEYRDFAMEEGEEVAASRVRRLKAEALR
jgi:hypothetical protein